MLVRINLMGGLKAKSPAGDKLDLPENATIEDALQALDVPAAHAQIVMLNNRPELDRTRKLTADDELTVLPAVAGG